MVQKLITRLLHRRHYWRYMEFSELSELYASRVLRITALNMVSVFVAIFMYQAGYSLTFIALYFTAQYLLRALFAFPAAHIIGWIGPKHATLFSNVLYIPALFSLSNLEVHGWGVLIGYGLFWALSVSVYTISHHVDFSKIKHRRHAGKEIGYMVALERIATAVSPIVGGGIAYAFGPQATVFAAMIMFAVAAAPLFLSPEPIPTRQHIKFKGFNLNRARRSIIAQTSIGWDLVSSGLVWSLFVAIAVFGTTSNALYAQVGAVASVTVIASALTARTYGKIIDTHRGGELLRIGVFGSALLQLIRPFIATASGVVLMNISSEAARSAYNMPFLKGAFDLTDDMPNYRIVYMAWLDFAVAIGSAAAMSLLALLSLAGTEIASLQLFYVASAVAVLGILLHGLRGIRIHG